VRIRVVCCVVMGDSADCFAMMAALLLLSPWSIRSILTEIDDCMVVLYTIQFNNKKGQTTNRMETVEVVVVRERIVSSTQWLLLKYE